MNNNNHHEERKPDEVWVFNVSLKTCDPALEAELKTIPSYRYGKQAYDIQGYELPEDYVPAFVKKSEYHLWDKIMMDRFRQSRKEYLGVL